MTAGHTGSGMRPRGAVAVLVLALSLSAALAAASGYHVSSDGATDIPERTVEVQQQTHTIDSMVRARAGDRVTVSVDAPDEVYRLHIRNSDERIVASKPGRGSGTFTYDLSGYEPGSYAIMPDADGVYQDVLPLLVSGYEVTVDAPSTAERGAQVEVSLDVSRVDTAVPPAPAKVQVVLAGGGETRTVEAAASASGYVATVDTSALDAGEYTLYGIAQGNEETSGRQELLGQSDSHSLTVREETGSTAPTGTDEGRSGEETSGTGTPQPGTDTSTPSTASPTTVSPTAPPVTPTDPGTASRTSAPGTSVDGRTTGAASESATGDGSAITPRTPTETPATRAPGDATPGFTVPGTAVAVLVGFLLLRRR